MRAPASKAGAGKANLQIAANQPVNARLSTTLLPVRVLAIGMTDTEVLNLPTCGRPARIVRNRESYTWREQWTYIDRSTGEEQRLLFFENGRLIKQQDATRPSPIEALATIQ